MRRIDPDSAVYEGCGIYHPSGKLQGKRLPFLNSDMNFIWHLRVAASFLGDSEVFISADAEQQCPRGGGFVSSIVGC